MKPTGQASGAVCIRTSHVDSWNMVQVWRAGSPAVTPGSSVRRVWEQVPSAVIRAATRNQLGI